MVDQGGEFQNMTNTEIEKLKSLLTKLLSKGATIKCEELGLEGRIVSVGYRPVWTEKSDTKIDKIVFNFADKYGRVTPLNINYVVGYEVVQFDERSLEDSNNIEMYIHVLSLDKVREKEPYDKLHLTIISK